LDESNLRQPQKGIGREKKRRTNAVTILRNAQGNRSERWGKSNLPANEHSRVFKVNGRETWRVASVAYHRHLRSRFHPRRSLGGPAEKMECKKIIGGGEMEHLEKVLKGGGRTHILKGSLREKP